MLLETLYAPTAKDRLAGLSQRVWVHRGSETDTAQNLLMSQGAGAPLAVPADIVRVITGFAVTFVSVAAEYPTGAVLAAIPQNSGAGSEVLIASVAFPGDFTAAGAVYAGQSAHCWAPMFPRDTFYIRCSKSAGVSNATWVIGLYGYEIPRANVQR